MGKKEHSHEHNHNNEHNHSHEHKHGVDHIHSHRNLIGFDEHGVPTITLKSDHEEDGDDKAFIRDYMNAVSEYRKTFPSKDEVLENTPDPAVKEMILRQNQLGFDTTFDRFDKQQPQCGFGMAGICCKICNMGPCKITSKSPKGVCGADADLIVARNLLRSAAAGAAQHGMHGREVILSLKWAAEGKLDLPILGQQKIKDTAKAFGIKTERRSIKKIASELADVLLDDMSRTVPGDYKIIEALGSEERKKVWKELDIIPISAYHEVFEAYHKTGVGTDGDWKSIMQQFLRCGLAFTYSGVVSTSIATDGLFGVGDRVTSKVNIGALKKGYVNIAVHGHLPTLVSEIVRVGQEEKFINLAKEAGAKGIRFYGICCSGLSAMYRYAGVIPLSNAVSAELVLGTGALDLWIADVQDVFPSIMEVAKCFRTTVVTTSESARLPGAERFEYDHHHSNIGETRELAEKIVLRGIESFKDRQGIPVYIPPYEVDAEVGFSPEYVHKHYGSMKPLYEAVREGKILGIVNIVGCNNPKVVYEKCVIDVANALLRNNILILTNGCASFPLMKMGYCNVSGQEHAGESLKEFLGDLPPVWHVGECIDNTKSSGIFAGVAGEASKPLYEMPFAFSSPEWSNEKGIDAALGFRLMGINSYHCVEAQIHGSKNVIEFLKEGTKEMLGSVMVVDTNPDSLGEKIVADIIEKRKALGWAVPDEIVHKEEEAVLV
ncbi:anaerobic carbon-monoxide dehydrogenase catalytic subunit [Lachnoanaerobaculum gingivalis]|uniref:anaerobic carbon-monoxide dehydrogenase n=2 Tax=Lachnoanaerobaculum gingivalis TaxID=2490855 RepID=A0A3P3R108_9FIRM|nr:anaerobic carbon-monoxide dehydrogenase catalytic subunit [Lachnoanaerobaculum gingivalis]RRJ27152.1 anaerobic carbon-monoxide dehydrogenase catalytic subunit [Lachnoanaerobaculum gingivalis]